MSAKKSTKPQHFVWNFFNKVEVGKTLKGICRYCAAEYVTHVDRQVKHILSGCKKAPQYVKNQLIINMKATGEYNKMKRKLPSYKEVSVTKAIDDVLLSSSVENDTLFDKTNNNNSSNLIEKEFYEEPEEHKLNKMKQSLVSTYIDRMNQSEQTNLTYLFAKAVYASNIPFQIVDSPYLKKFFDALRPTFKLPSRKQLAGKLLDNAFTETSNHISSCIKNAKCIAIVSDGWSNQRNESIINYNICLLHLNLCSTNL